MRTGCDSGQMRQAGAPLSDQTLQVFASWRSRWDCYLPAPWLTAAKRPAFDNADGPGAIDSAASRLFPPTAAIPRPTVKRFLQRLAATSARCHACALPLCLPEHRARCNSGISPREVGGRLAYFPALFPTSPSMCR